MIGEVGIRHERADADAAVRCLFNLVQRQTRNIDQSRGAFDIFLHQVDQIGAACDELRSRIGRHLPHRVGDVVGSCVLEIDHDFSIACWIAATMFGYAPQRQMLPLISSRISSAVFALPSAMSPTAEQICPGVQ